MVRWAKFWGVVSVAVALGASWSAPAQTVRHKTNHQSPSGHNIVVRPGKSYLTAGTGANVGAYNGYVRDTSNQPPPTEGTFTGMRGQERLLLNRFDGPGIPLFRF